MDKEEGGVRGESKATSSWRAPGRIELDPQRQELRYWPGDEITIEDDERVLAEFVGLAEASDKAILDYARKWGVLELCRDHGLPRVHKPPMALGRALPSYEDDFCVRRRSPHAGQDVPFCESLDDWRRLAKQLRSIIDAAIAKPERITSTGEPLTTAVQKILDIANIRPVVRWSVEKGFWIGIGSPEKTRADGSQTPCGLFVAIATHLAVSLSRSDGLATCSGCGLPYSLADGRPRTGANQFCAECRATGVPEKIRQRRRRARARAEETQ